MADDDLTSNPLHFESVPSDGAPPYAELLGTGMLVAWLASKKALATKHAKSPLRSKLDKREITGREFLSQALRSRLRASDVSREMSPFLYGYVHRLFLDEARVPTAKAIAKLLGMRRDDEIAFNDDYLATFKGVVKNPFHVPDTWEAYDRFAPILDARWEDFQKTKFVKDPPKGLYEKAAKLRDARAFKVSVPKPKATAVDDTLTDELLALVGKPLGDASVKATLAKAGLPIGKRVDAQALPSLGVEYMGAKIGATLSVTSVTFWRKGQKAYVRGLGAEVVFAQYPGPLPYKLSFDDGLDEARKKLGKPSDVDDNDATWELKGGRAILVAFARKKIASVALVIRRR